MGIGVPFVRSRLRYVPQVELAECGAACLAMVLDYHGSRPALVDLRMACGVSRDGVSALGILKAARAHGLDARGLRLEVVDLARLSAPAILHWNFNHFVVLERLVKSGAVIVDPASGRRRVSHEELSGSFTGVALEFSAGAGFEVSDVATPGLSRYASTLRDRSSAVWLILVLSFSLELLGMALPAVNQFLVDYVLVQSRGEWLTGLAIGVAGIGAILLISTFLRDFAMRSLQMAMDLHLMQAFAEHLLSLPLAFFHQRTPGDLLARSEANSTLRELCMRVVTGGLDAFLVLGYGVLMLAYNARIGACVLLLSALRVGLAIAVRERVQQYSATELTLAAAEQSARIEAFASTECTKAFGAEERLVERHEVRLSRRINTGLSLSRWTDGFGQLLLLFEGGRRALVFWMGGHAVIAGDMTIGTFVGFLALQELISRPLMALTDSVSEFIRARSVLMRLDDILSARPEARGGREPGMLRGEVELRGVSFTYSASAQPACRDVSFRVPAGGSLAIVGTVGSGKSTIGKLLCGLLEPTAGSIRVDGHDLRDLNLRAYRRQLGVVLQEPFILNDSAYANIGFLDPSLPLEDVEEAARTACIDHVLEALPDGYFTRLGPAGMRLSGGERQRLAIARAVARSPRILILDEAYGALDPDTERAMHARLQQLRCTRITISHRLATLRDADQIIVLEHGRVAQQGSFVALSRTPGRLRAMLACGALEP